MVGLFETIKKKTQSCGRASKEMKELEEKLKKQREIHLADFDIKVACACCKDGS